jgi:hypothetical protein
LKILKTKPIDFIRIKSHLDISILYPLGKKKIDEQKESHFKGTFENKV